MKRLFFAGAGPMVFLLMFLSSHSSVHAAFGISPPFLNADHLVPGSQYTETVYLVQDQPKDDIRIKAELTVPEAVRSWIKIDKGFDFVIPKGTRQFPVTLTVAVPNGAVLAQYKGNLSFTTMPNEAGQVTIALGVQVAINLSVGTGIYRKLSVPLIRFLDIEEGWNPKVYVKFDNEGNIAESFDGATYELQDQFGAVRLAYAQRNNDLPAMPPFTIGDYVVEFPIDFHLGIGQYWGNVTFYKDGNAVANQRTVFNVLKRGAIASPMKQFLGVVQEQGPYYGGGFVALGGVFAFFRKRRANRRKSIMG